MLAAELLLAFVDKVRRAHIPPTIFERHGVDVRVRLLHHPSAARTSRAAMDDAGWCGGPRVTFGTVESHLAVGADVVRRSNDPLNPFTTKFNLRLLAFLPIFQRSARLYSRPAHSLSGRQPGFLDLFCQLYGCPSVIRRTASTLRPSMPRDVLAVLASSRPDTSSRSGP